MSRTYLPLACPPYRPLPRNLIEQIGREVNPSGTNSARNKGIRAIVDFVRDEYGYAFPKGAVKWLESSGPPRLHVRLDLVMKAIIELTRDTRSLRHVVEQLGDSGVNCRENLCPRLAARTAGLADDYPEADELATRLQGLTEGC